MWKKTQAFGQGQCHKKTTSPSQPGAGLQQLELMNKMPKIVFYSWNNFLYMLMKKNVTTVFLSNLVHQNTTLIDGVYWHYYWYQSDKISTSLVWDQKVQRHEIKEMSMSSPTLCFCLCRSCVCDDSLRHLSANSAVSALSGFRSSPSKFLHPLCLTLVSPLLIT